MGITLKCYEIEYASAMFRNEKYKQTTTIYSDCELELGAFVIVEHIDCGIFIGKVIRFIELDPIIYESDEDIKEDVEYRFIQHINLEEYLANIEKQEKKKILEEKMKEEFKRIDEKKKFEYYATLDEDFKKIYDEYKKLGD